MTANRIIDDHSDLDGIGQISHPQIDSHINTTPFIVVSGSTNVPASARNLKAGTNVTITDGGPGQDLVINSTGGSTGSLNIVPTRVGQLLFAVTPDKFSAALPIVSANGWLINLTGLLLVSASI